MGNKKDYESDEQLIRIWSTYIPEETINELKKVLESTWINTGKKEKLLRETFRKRFNIPFCVACNSGTSALRAGLDIEYWPW